MSRDENQNSAEEPDRSNNRVDLSGNTAADLVQARDVHGGVHFHRDNEPAFSVIPRQLPGLNRGFVNRTVELAHLARVLEVSGEGQSVVVITGTAGVGKTSLALRWAHELRDQHPDGQLYVNLRGYDPSTPAVPEDVLGRFLRDLGVPPGAMPHELDDRASLFRSVLAGRRVLVVLDNAATVRQVRPLLPGSRECLVIVTSRSRLSGLVVREGAARVQLDLLGADAAVALLRVVTEGYRDHDEHADLLELTALCARLPLALRIAAERAAGRPRMRLSELIADLRHESGNLWTALTPDGDDDADAVRTVFAWSYRALTPQDAELFRLLGLHPGAEFGIPAAAALVGLSTNKARQSLEALVGAQLIEQSGTGRYQFHDLLRAYSVDQLRQWEQPAAGENALNRVLSWYLHTADAAQRAIAPFDHYRLADEPPAGVEPLTFDNYESALFWYRTESQNLVAAVRQARTRGLNAVAWKFAAVLRAIYIHQNSFDDWIMVGMLALEAATELGAEAAEAEALDTLARAYFQARRLDLATTHHRRLLATRRRLGDRFGEAKSVNALGLLDLRRRQLLAAQRHFETGADLFTTLGERRWSAMVRTNLAETLTDGGNHLRAVELAHGSLRIFRELGDRFGVGNGLFTVAKALRSAGDLHDAEVAITEALTIAEDDDNDVWRAHWLVELANIELEAGRPSDALVNYHQAAVLHRRLGDRSREAMAIAGSGRAFQLLGNEEEAVRFHLRAVQVHRELGDQWQWATALDHLASALDQEGEFEQARRHRRDALPLLAEFDDAVAVAMRQRIEAEAH